MPKISETAFNARRERILQAARHSFARRGIHVSVDEICQEAGVSKGALYGYFPSKDAIIQAIADHHAADFATIARASGMAELQALLLSRANEVSPETCRLELEAWTYSLTHEALRERLVGNTTALGAALTAALEGLERAGKVRLRIPARDAAAVLETFAIGLVAKTALGSGGGRAAAGQELACLVEALVES
jgi:AcrR family transcriptional regulator